MTAHSRHDAERSKRGGEGGGEWQPWASLIMAGAKPYEFRSWPVPGYVIDKRIGIHAGARPVRKAEVPDLILRLKSDEAWSTCLRKDIALPLLERVHASPGILPLSSMLGTAVIGRAVRSYDIIEEFGGGGNDSDRTLFPPMPVRVACSPGHWRPGWFSGISYFERGISESLALAQRAIELDSDYLGLLRGRLHLHLLQAVKDRLLKN